MQIRASLPLLFWTLAAAAGAYAAALLFVRANGLSVCIQSGTQNDGVELILLNSANYVALGGVILICLGLIALIRYNVRALLVPVALTTGTLFAAVLIEAAPGSFSLNNENIAPTSGHGYVCRFGLTSIAKLGNDWRHRNRSNLVLTEDAHALGPYPVYRGAEKTIGRGAYLHRKKYLYFSASDNSNPLENGKEYAAEVGWRQIWRLPLFALLVGFAYFVVKNGARRVVVVFLGMALPALATLAILEASFRLFDLPLAFRSVGQGVPTERLGTPYPWEGLELSVDPYLQQMLNESLAYEHRRQELWDSPTLPEQWKRREFEGGYEWHNVRHTFNEHRFRGASWEQKERRSIRVMALGDSLTYGYGVPEEWTWPAVLERLLRNRNMDVVVYNLGVSGNQIFDTYAVAEEWIPKLKPDYVVYGFCLNDYLPSGIGEYAGLQWALPIPADVKDWLVDNSVLFGWTNDRYDVLLRRYGLRRNFFQDVLYGFEHDERGTIRAQFDEGVLGLARLIKEYALAPMTVGIINQHPTNSSGRRMYSPLESALQMHPELQYVDVDRYFALIPDELDRLRVSRWEGHPNAAAQVIFATAFADAIQRGIDQ